MDNTNRLRRSIAASESGIVVDWLLKVVISLVIVGVLLFELGAVVLVRLTAADTAAKSGEEGGFIIRGSGSEEQAEAAAKAYAEKEGATLVSFTVDTENKTTITTVRKKAKTIFIHKIGFLKRFAETTATQEVPIGT